MSFISFLCRNGIFLLLFQTRNNKSINKSSTFLDSIEDIINSCACSVIENKKKKSFPFGAWQINFWCLWCFQVTNQENLLVVSKVINSFPSEKMFLLQRTEDKITLCKFMLSRSWSHHGVTMHRHALCRPGGFIIDSRNFSNMDTLEWGKKYWDRKVCYSSLTPRGQVQGDGRREEGQQGARCRGEVCGHEPLVS